MKVIQMRYCYSPYYLTADSLLERLKDMDVPNIKNEINEKKYLSLTLLKDIQDTLNKEGKCKLEWDATKSEQLSCANSWKHVLEEFADVSISIVAGCVLKKL